MNRTSLLVLPMIGALTAVAGTTCRDGVARAIPVADGRAPVIDGRLDDWDKSGAVLCWNAEVYADRQNATLYIQYDAENLYFAAEMGLFDHDNTNPNRPEDRYWNGDLIQLRLSTDRALPYPLPARDRRNPPGNPYYRNDKVTCVNLWKNSSDGKDFLYVTPGANFDLPGVKQPRGSAMKAVAGDRTLTIESRIPWSALGVRDGKCPFKPGDRMPACVDIKWNPGTDGHYTAAIYRVDPGAFAFLNLQHWGQIEFLAKGDLPPLKESYASVAASARGAVDVSGCAEIRFRLPKRAKVSVNIFDEQGGVIRELAGGEPHEPGDLVFYWDGRDALGFPCETGRTYRWGVYAHDGLDVSYFGTVGTSGEPPYETRDGCGGWGADHGPVVDAACDDTGRYFVWNQSEAGKGIVKTDFDGKVIWRSSPFVVSGWGSYSCLTSDGRFLYLVYESRSDRGRLEDPIVKLVKVDVRTGPYELWPGNVGATDIAISPAPPPLPPKSAVRPCFLFNCVGVAVKGDEIFISDFIGSRVLVHSAQTGLKTGEFPLAGPRGLWLHADGRLYAACLRGGKGVVTRVDLETKAETVVVADGLELPHGLALDAAGDIYVSDLGDAQQVKRFSRGSFVRAYGKKGGRGYLGRVDTDAFLYPFGLAIDRTGALMIPEASTPKIVTLLDTEDGRVLNRYYGYTAYSPSNVPDCDDPLLPYYSLSGPDSFARARLPETGGAGLPDASWDFVGAGIDEFQSIMNTMNMPVVLRGANGRKYLVSDGTACHRDPTQPKPVCLIAGDRILPVAACFTRREKERRPKRHVIELWTDANGDHRVQPEEKQTIESVGGRTFRLADHDGAFLMTEDGAAFILTQENFLIGVPARGWSSDGVPQWDAKAAYLAIPEILPGMKELHCSWRRGFSGFRRDRAGNFYASVTAEAKYATDAYTKYMHQGMGHTADVGAVFMTKYDPSGRLVWRAGRKAVGGMKDGEILHHWCYAGLVNDAYSVAASEWGVFTFYTHDGFYVDHVFDVPGLPGRGIPYAFGGEDFSGRVQYFPARGEVWAYNAGHTFRVLGFEPDGRVKGEWRTSGRVELETVKPLVFPGCKAKPLSDIAFRRADGRLLFTAHVADATPLVNVAPSANAVFKGGDAVGFELGPSVTPREIPERKPSQRRLGFTRILAARMNGRDVVVGFKPFTDGPKRPQSYATPAGGKSDFEFCGEIADATVVFTVDADGKGYRAEIAVPQSFFELDFSQKVFADAEVLLSGEGGRGLQTVEKAYLHTPDSSSVLMVDDVPTEARLHPHGWVEMAEMADKKERNTER